MIGSGDDVEKERVSDSPAGAKGKRALAGVCSTVVGARPVVCGRVELGRIAWNPPAQRLCSACCDMRPEYIWVRTLHPATPAISCHYQAADLYFGCASVPL